MSPTAGLLGAVAPTVMVAKPDAWGADRLVRAVLALVMSLKLLDTKSEPALEIALEVSAPVEV
jgi:hypothetical protein